jgi:ATP-binding cassette subfamily F protein 3
MINISNVTKYMGGVPLYTGANFQINPGEKVGLVGPNGAGKTTFFNMIVGEYKPDEGQVSTASGTTIAYFSQNVGEMRGNTALEEVVNGKGNIKELNSKLRDFEAKLCDPEIDPNEMNKILEEMGEVQTKFEELGGYEVEQIAGEILSGLGFKIEDHQRPVEDFSGGWKMRIALAKVLITNPDAILMDEPTNYLDMETILWLEEWLKNFKGALLMTSHDREFMNNVVKKIVEVTPSGVTTFGGNYDFYEQEKEVRKKQNEAEFNRQQSMLKKEEEFIAKFKARASHAAQVQSRVKKIEKIDRVEVEADLEKMSILLPEIPRGGNDVFTIKNVSKSYSLSDGNKLEVFKGLNATITRQEKLAVVGVNGAGKSTLLKCLSGSLKPDNGEVKIGPSIKAGYFGQYSFENLNMNLSVFDQVKQLMPNASDGFIRNLLAAFLFKGDEVFKTVKVLSGGEKARVILAGLLSTPYNCLILDEPTNHLDIHSREVLLDALKRYEGTIIFVSHDRFFLKELASKVLLVDKGSTYLFPGNYKEFVQKHKH